MNALNLPIKKWLAIQIDKEPLSREALATIVRLLAEARAPVDSSTGRCLLCNYHKDDEVIGPHGAGCPWKLARENQGHL
jgi:hypothetical protein